MAAVQMLSYSTDLIRKAYVRWKVLGMAKNTNTYRLVVTINRDIVLIIIVTAIDTDITDNGLLLMNA